MPPSLTPALSRTGVRNSLIGGAAWILGVAWVRPGLAESLLLAGPLLAVPLGLELAAPGRQGAARRGRWRFALRLQLPAALLVIVSFAVPPGPWAALSSLPWLLFCAFVALLGLLRLAESGPLSSAEVSIDAGLIFIAVGGVWTLSSRWGRGFLGFQEPIVLLTGAHFHFAGFVLPILTGLAGRALPGRHARLAAAGVVTGVPLVALGITLSPRGFRLVEFLAAWWMTVAALLVAALQVRVAARRSNGRNAVLLAVSACALAGGMILAAVYAFGTYLGSAWVGIPAMVRLHATANVFGFALPGLLYWTIAGPAREGAACRILLPWLGDEPDLAEWEARAFAPAVEAGPRPGDARDAHEGELALEGPGEPEPRGPYRRAAEAILRFDVFPRRIVTPLLARQPVEVGDTVACRGHVVKGVDVVFAARVTARFEETRNGVSRTGFTYRTLEGHPFTGEETFAVEKDTGSGRVRVAIRSWSRPEGLFARAFYRWVRRLQLRAGQAGVEQLRNGSITAG